MAAVLAFLLVGSVLVSAELQSFAPGQHVETRAQDASAAPAVRASAATAPEVAVAEPPGYVIGPDDVLAVVFWRDKDMSSEVVVRADGKISLPLLNDVQAAGLTPLQLRAQLEVAAARFVEDAVATVVVKQINSRKVFITGMVEKPGAYPLTGPMTTLQLIATAGGFKDFANTSNIVVVRSRGAQQQFLKFNYQDVARGRRKARDIELQPGDSVIVR